MPGTLTRWTRVKVGTSSWTNVDRRTSDWGSDCEVQAHRVPPSGSSAMPPASPPPTTAVWNTRPEAGSQNSTVTGSPCVSTSVAPSVVVTTSVGPPTRSGPGCSTPTAGVAVTVTAGAGEVTEAEGPRRPAPGFSPPRPSEPSGPRTAAALRATTATAAMPSRLETRRLRRVRVRAPTAARCSGVASIRRRSSRRVALSSSSTSIAPHTSFVVASRRNRARPFAAWLLTVPVLHPRAAAISASDRCS